MRPLDTSEMDTKQMSEFMDRISAWAAGFKIRLPVPEDLGRAA